MRTAQRIGSFDNVWTTMLVGFGVLPTSVYLAMLLGYFLRFVRATKTSRKGLHIHAIGLSLLACMVQFLIYDGLLYPQISWFFHFFIGLLPLGTAHRE
jgi:O-antigen ligase